MLEDTLKDAIGEFGEKHCNKKDNPAYFIHMTAMSDFPDDYDPG